MGTIELPGVALTLEPKEKVSAAVPDLILLESPPAGRAAAPARAAAVENLGRAVADLASFRGAEGGFAYWPESPDDLALTGYVVQFMAEAGRFVPVAPEVLGEAVGFLTRAQRADGRWDPPQRRLPHRVERGRALTAWLARALAEVREPLPESQRLAARQAAERALAYLAPDLPALSDPYAVACAVLAETALGRSGLDEARQAAERLRELARAEAGGRFWELQTNTPFAGWGNAGRLETTALAVQALLAAHSGAPPDPVAEGGLVYLLLHKGGHGDWMSTQATAQVLRALAALEATEERAKSDQSGKSEERGNSAKQVAVAMAQRPAPLELTLDGLPVGRLAENELDPLVPWSLVLTEPLAPGRHRVSVRGGGVGEAEVPAAQATPGAAWRLLEVVAHESLPWNRATGGAAEGNGPPAPTAPDPSLALTVACGPLAVSMGDPVTCRVHAERIGFAGDSMLIVEIGLPPAVDDREALDAFKAGMWSFSDYEIWPDRMVIYVWPRAGGLSFPLTFRPRLAMQARALPSLLFDAYNPEARVVVPPPLFVVRPPGGGPAMTQ